MKLPHKKILIPFFWIGLLVFQVPYLYAQKLHFDEDKLASFKEDSDYNYEEFVVTEGIFSKFISWLSKHYDRIMRSIFGDYDAGSFWGFVIRYFPYLIIFGVIILIVYLFVKYNWGSRFFGSQEEEPIVLFSEEEEIIRNKDIDALIQKALAKNNFRLAIRYQYLKCLRFLDNENKIIYAFSKTNQDYIEEVKHLSVAALFGKITYYYDYAWYGGFSVSLAQYQQVEKNFRAFEQKIKQATND